MNQTPLELAYECVEAGEGYHMIQARICGGQFSPVEHAEARRLYWHRHPFRAFWRAFWVPW
jgi:hypothetical protein